eukprot:g2676.t2
MTLTSHPPCDLLNSMESYSYPLPPESFVPAVWFLGAHMLKCILEIEQTEKETIKHKPDARRSHSRTERITKIVSSTVKVQKRASPAAKGRKSENKISRGAQTSVKGKTNPQSASKTVSRAGKQSSNGPDGNRGTDCKRNRSIEFPEASRPVPSREKKIDSPKKQKRNSTSSVKQQQQQQHPMTKENIKQGAQLVGESLKQTRPNNNVGRNSVDSWLPNPVYSSRELETNEVRTDRSELSLPWVAMTSFTSTQSVDLNQPISKRILKTVKETTTQAKMQIKAHPVCTEQKSEATKAIARSVPVRRVPNRTSFDLPPSSATEKKVLSETDIAIRNTIERKLGKPLSEVDPASLKVISEERMKELMQKYGAGPNPSRKSIDSAMTCINKHRLKDPNESAYPSACQMNPQHER